VSIVPWTFVDFIFHHARTQPEKAAVILSDRVATYDMMAQGTLRVEDRIAALGLTPHEPVCIAVDNPIRHMIVAAALFRRGHPVLSANKASELLPHRLPVSIALQSEPAPLIPGWRQIVIGDDWFAGERRTMPATPSAGFESEQSICRIDLSSGTTGRPKALSLSVAAAHAWMKNYYSAIGLGNWNRLLILPGLNTNWGFTLAAHALTTGRTMVRATTPSETLHMISVYGVDALVLSSQHLRELVRVQARAMVPCSSLRIIMTAGGLMSRSLMTEARTRLCSTIINQYGSSEAGSTAYAFAEQISDTEGATGFAVPGAEIQVIDDNGNLLPPDTEGVLRVRTNWLAQPYPPKSEASDASIRDGWFYPGDRGRIAPDGLLVLTGRVSDVINAGGVKVSPDVVEEIVLNHPNIAEAGAFGVMGSSGVEEICIAIISRAPLSEKHVIEWCAERNLPVTHVFFVDSLPKTALGKIQRAELKTRFFQ